MVKEGGFGKFHHHRELAPIDNQTVIRLNRDTLYSSAVFDLDAGPVTITLPDAGKRFMSMQVINEDHYTPAVVYGAGSHTLTQGEDRHALRRCGDPHAGRSERSEGRRAGARPAGRDQGRASRAARQIRGAELGSGEPEEGARRAAGARATTCRTSRRAFGAKDEVDPVRHLIGTAAGWGGNPDKDAIYLNVTPQQERRHDRSTSSTSRTCRSTASGRSAVYNAEGYLEKNPLNAYSLNNITAKKSADGSVAIQFGGCDGKIPNCLPIMQGWNYTVRLYRPRAEILNGKLEIPGGAAGELTESP